MRKLVVIMGPSGSGKSTVARTLASQRGWPFVEADDFHPAENIALMQAGSPLSDADRASWLDRMTPIIADVEAECVVTACSALTPYVQQRIASECDREVVFVLLDVPARALAERLSARRGHFMDPSLLESQLAALAIPENAIRIDAHARPEVVLARVGAALNEE